MQHIKKSIDRISNQQFKKETVSYQQLIANIFGSKQIAYNPDLVKITGSINSAILLNQLLYWYRKGRNPEWFYKTMKDIYEETALTRAQQELAIKKLKKSDLIEIELRGIPAKRYFKINIDEITKKAQDRIKIDDLSQ